MVTISARNTNILKICKLPKAIFSVFYNILQPNFAILLMHLSMLTPRGGGSGKGWGFDQSGGPMGWDLD